MSRYSSAAGLLVRCFSVFFFVVLAGCAGSGASRNSAAERHEIIRTDRAPAAIGPYSQAVRVGDTVYLSGQIGLDPATGALVPGGVRTETRQALQNIQAVLEAAGFTFSDVVQVQVYLADLADFASMNEEYASRFGTAPPARATLQAAALPKGARVEIMVTAVH